MGLRGRPCRNGFVGEEGCDLGSGLAQREFMAIVDVQLREWTEVGDVLGMIMTTEGIDRVDMSIRREGGGRARAAIRLTVVFIHPAGRYRLRL